MDMPGEKEGRKRMVHAISGGVFLIGLAVLFYFDLFWPWILALVGVITILEALAKR
jgi:hypothetical protein